MTKCKEQAEKQWQKNPLYIELLRRTNHRDEKLQDIKGVTRSRK